MFAHGAWHDAPVVAADALTTVDGPALIVRADTQIALAPGWRATRRGRRPDPPHPHRRRAPRRPSRSTSPTR